MQWHPIQGIQWLSKGGKFSQNKQGLEYLKPVKFKNFVTVTKQRLSCPLFFSHKIQVSFNVIVLVITHGSVQRVLSVEIF